MTGPLSADSSLNDPRKAAPADEIAMTYASETSAQGHSMPNQTDANQQSKMQREEPKSELSLDKSLSEQPFA